MLQDLTRTSELLDDGLHNCGPDEGVQVLVPDGHVVVDGVDEILDADENTTAEGLTGQLSKPALHEVEPA